MDVDESDKTEGSVDDMEDLREGTSENTIATPDDFPKAYDYGTGRIQDYSRDAMLKKMPEPAENQTVLNTKADPDNIQVLYLWEKDNVPAVTDFTKDMTGYFDNWDFRPYVTAIPVKKGVTPKGAVVLMAGGAYQFRGNYTDAYVPDELDQIPAHASADGMIYSFYGRLSVGNMDQEWLKEGDLPPTFYVYGTEDPFYDQFERQYQVLRDMGIRTERIVLNGWPHGFGSDGGWVQDYANWLEDIFHNKDNTVTKDDITKEDVTEGTEKYKGFLVDNVLHSEAEGDIHYNVYIPDSYNDSKDPYALFVTLPGYQGLYFQGVAENIKTEDFGFEAQKYNEKMIIVAPQLNDWAQTSADQTIVLTEYFLNSYRIDSSKVYIDGYSGGGYLFCRDKEIMGWLFAH